MSQAYFRPALFQFLRELAAHNDRDWFIANKQRYQADVRDPALAFIAALAPRLRKLSPHFVADPKPVGGSLFRIHRDVRFSSDKSPYKTHVDAAFHHGDCEGSSPGFYLRLQPGEVMTGAGMWHPEPPALGRVRDAIAAAPAEWTRAKKGLELDGESLKRPPKGYDAEHPAVEDLKRKDFITGFTHSERQACAPDFLDRFVDDCKQALPLVRFLGRALALPV